MGYILEVIKKYTRNKSFGCFSKRDRKDLDKYIENNMDTTKFKDLVSKLNDKDLEDVMQLRYVEKQKYDYIALELFLTETVVKDKIIKLKYYLYGTMQ